ncbi:unnamed protein product [Mucor circinelloides]
MTMNSTLWVQLPYEIQTRIFRHLDHDALIELQKACRYWKLAAIELLYNEITIHTDGKRRRENKLIQVLGHSDNLAKYFVKKVIVDEHWRDTKTSRDYSILSALGSLCPNLMIVESNRPTRQFYRELLELRLAGHLEKVEYISDPRYSQTKNYYKTMMLFKDTLAEILVNRDLSIDLPETGSIKAAFKIANHLGQFKCLKRLHIDLAKDVGLHKVEELLALCSGKLETLTVTMAIRQEEETFGDDCIDIQSLHRLPSVKKLTVINRERLSNQDMVYIMHKFPELKYLHSFSEGPYSKQPDVGFYSPDIVQQFFRYISHLYRCHLSAFRATPILVLDAISQLSRGFKVDDLLVNACDEADDEKFAYLTILEPTRTQKLYHTVHVILPTLHINPLYQTTLEAFAQQITKLRLYGTMDSNAALFSDTQIVTNRALSESIKFILSSFTRLRKLHLYNLIISTRPPSTIPTAKLHIDDLYIYQCALIPHALKQMSQYLNCVDRFYLGKTSFWISNGMALVDGQRHYDIDMPHTAFGSIDLCDNNIAKLVLVKICTETTVHFFHLDNINATYRGLTQEEYDQIKTSNNTIQRINIACRKYTVVDFGYCRLPIMD